MGTQDDYSYKPSSEKDGYGIQGLIAETLFNVPAAGGIAPRLFELNEALPGNVPDHLNIRHDQTQPTLKS